MSNGVYIKRTLEQLMQEWNPKLWIRELDNEDVDSVMFGDKHICCIPKGGKVRTWFDMMADSLLKESDQTSDAIPHRTMAGLVQTLMARGIIDINSSLGAQANVDKFKL